MISLLAQEDSEFRKLQFKDVRERLRPKRANASPVTLLHELMSTAGVWPTTSIGMLAKIHKKRQTGT